MGKPDRDPLYIYIQLYTQHQEYQLHRYYQHRLNVPVEDVGYLNPRPSIKPVALGVLAAET